MDRDQGESGEPRERIRDAALRQFAEHGFKGASVRGIAADAGVSPGLVQHHFATKDKLREACDAYVLEVIWKAKDAGVLGGAISDPAYVGRTHGEVGAVSRYLAAMLLGDSDTGDAWFDQMFEVYRAVLTDGELGPAVPEDEDPDAVAAVHTAWEMDLGLLAHHVYRRLGVRPDDPAAAARIGRARLYLAAHRGVHPEIERRVKDALDQYERVEPQGEDGC